MPILESIQNSEKQAEEIRENARKDVEALIQKTNEENQKLENDILNSARQKVKEIQEKVQDDLQLLEKEIENQQLEKNNIDRQKALTKMEVAVDFIIDKVVNS